MSIRALCASYILEANQATDKKKNIDTFALLSVLFTLLDDPVHTYFKDYLTNQDREVYRQQIQSQHDLALATLKSDYKKACLKEKPKNKQKRQKDKQYLVKQIKHYEEKIKSIANQRAKQIKLNIWERLVCLPFLNILCRLWPFGVDQYFKWQYKKLKEYITVLCQIYILETDALQNDEKRCIYSKDKLETVVDYFLKDISKSQVGFCWDLIESVKQSYSNALKQLKTNYQVLTSISQKTKDKEKKRYSEIIFLTKRLYRNQCKKRIDAFDQSYYRYKQQIKKQVWKSILNSLYLGAGIGSICFIYTWLYFIFCLGINCLPYFDLKDYFSFALPQIGSVLIKMLYGFSVILDLISENFYSFKFKHTFLGILIISIIWYEFTKRRLIPYRLKPILGKDNIKKNFTFKIFFKIFLWSLGWCACIVVLFYCFLLDVVSPVVMHDSTISPASIIKMFIVIVITMISVLVYLLHYFSLKEKAVAYWHYKLYHGVSLIRRGILFLIVVLLFNISFDKKLPKPSVIIQQRQGQTEINNKKLQVVAGNSGYLFLKENSPSKPTIVINRNQISRIQVPASTAYTLDNLKNFIQSLLMIHHDQKSQLPNEKSRYKKLRYV